MEIYTVRHLKFSYPGQNRRVLDDLSFSIGQGQFVTLCGPSGCGKTTLLRQLKTVLTPQGERSGEIYFEDKLLSNLDQRAQSSRIGFVMQSADNQIVTDKVWHELAFGMESLGFDTPTTRLRVAEMASFFGIQTWFHQDVNELSGGQKQLLNLAAIMVLQPSVLILDEPIGQLNPIAATEFLTAIGKINRELGVTVFMTEHRLEEVFPLSDRVLVMDEGHIIYDDTPHNVGMQLKERQHSMFFAIPVPMRIYAGVENNLSCPVTVREGRKWLNSFADQHPLGEVPMTKPLVYENKSTPAVELKDVWFRYEKDAPDVVKGLSAKIFPGEFYAILGGNATGKTTTLSLISGINQPYRGTVRINGQDRFKSSDRQLFNRLLGVLPQNPQALFVEKTLKEDLYEMLREQKLSKTERENRVQAVAGLCRLNDLFFMHPYDLSGGEQQRAALAKVLLLQPEILLLDEPTKGLDAEFKQVFANILNQLLQKGVAIIMVSHDIEFCAQYAHRCALFFDGSIVSTDLTRRFFSCNSFYTTAANRMARHKIPSAVTPDDVITACGGDVKTFNVKRSESTNSIFYITSGQSRESWEDHEPVSEHYNRPRKLTPRRKITASLAMLAFLATMMYGFIEFKSLAILVGGGDAAAGLTGHPSVIWRYALLIFVLAAELAICYTALHPQESDSAINKIQIVPDKRRLSKRTWVAMLMILFVIPLTIYAGIYFFDDRKYYFISMLIIFETMLPFVLIFEDHKPQARELIIISVLCAIGVAGRAAFFMLPQFKPVVAIVIISAVAFGGETGFMVGAVTAFVSNIFFGQGPWTPWQMFAFSIIGFLAGVLFRKGILHRNTGALCLFGWLATFFIYGGIMNPASVLMFQNHPTKEMFYLVYLQGIPFDLIHATATAFFLLFIAQPMLEKLDRIKLKYNLLEN